MTSVAHSPIRKPRQAAVESFGVDLLHGHQTCGGRVTNKVAVDLPVKQLLSCRTGAWHRSYCDDVFYPAAISPRVLVWAYVFMCHFVACDTSRGRQSIGETGRRDPELRRMNRNLDLGCYHGKLDSVP